MLNCCVQSKKEGMELGVIFIEVKLLDDIPKDRWDAIISNDTSIKDFYNKLDILVNNIMKK